MDIAREAGELARRRRTEGVAIAATKSAIADIVTEADREVEALIRARLADRASGRRVPRRGVGRRAAAQTDITWVVDPIDGTVNYAYGIPAYAVSIAAVAGEPEPGPLGGARRVPCSARRRTSCSTPRRERARGCDGDRLAVNAEPSPAGALLATGFGYDPATHAGDLARVARVMPIARDLRRIGAASLDFAYRRRRAARRLLRARACSRGTTPPARSLVSRGGRPDVAGRARTTCPAVRCSWQPGRDSSTGCSRRPSVRESIGSELIGASRSVVHGILRRIPIVFT